jgi:glutamate-ammonia-ligase adenylyltransferase
MTRLADRLIPCGPVLDAKAAERAHEAIAKRVGEALGGVDAAWPALAPVFSASSYLASLARRDGKRLPRILEGDPDQNLTTILAAAEAVAAEPDFETARRVLRELKADLHLLTALCDLGGDLGPRPGDRRLDPVRRRDPARRPGPGGPAGGRSRCAHARR